MTLNGALTVDRIQEAIAAKIATPGLTITEIAADLHSSRSQLQRILAAGGTSFTEQLTLHRRRVATRLLIQDRLEVRVVAARVGICPDHLRAILRPAVGIGPGDLRRASRLLERIRIWRDSTPPRFGTRGYWIQRLRWDRAEGALNRLLDPIPTGSPLRGWADRALVAAKRPDYRSRPHRARVHDARLKERRRFTEGLQRALAEMGYGVTAGAPEEPEAGVIEIEDEARH